MEKRALNSRDYQPDVKYPEARVTGMCDLWKAYPKMLGTFVHLLRGTDCICNGKETGIRIPGFLDRESWPELPESLAEMGTESSAENGVESCAESLAESCAESLAESCAESLAESCAESLAESCAEERDPDSVLCYYRKLVALRREYPVISEGSTRFLKTGNEKVLAYERALGRQRLTVVCSFSAGEEETVGIPLQGYVILCNYPAEKENGAADRDLRPFEAVAVLREET